MSLLLRRSRMIAERLTGDKGRASAYLGFVAGKLIKTINSSYLGNNIFDAPRGEITG